jgi:hypothetical protein
MAVAQPSQGELPAGAAAATAAHRGPDAVVAVLGSETDGSREARSVAPEARSLLPDVSRPKALSPSLKAMAGELRWIFSERKSWLVGLGFNLAVAVVYVGYEHFHPHSHDEVRIAGIATETVAWVLADVINTNQLGADADYVSRSLDSGHSITREMALKNLALACLLFPAAFVLSVGVRLAIDHWRAIPHAVMFDLSVVFVWLGVGSLLSVLLPYRPIPLRERWRNRKSWFRWCCCLVAPYVVLFAIIRPLRWPADQIASLLYGSPELHELGYSFVYMVYGFVLWAVCLALVGLYGALAPHRLRADLRRTD